MGKLFVEFNQVSFSYESQSDWTLHDLSLRFSVGWTAVVGPNGAGKSTLLKLAAGLLAPVQGGISGCNNSIYCQQRTDHIPERFQNFLRDEDHLTYVLKGKLGIHNDWINRWETLSHGERKRAQIAAALWQQPELLAIDEPTNHLDYQACEYLLEGLRTFTGVGLIVSHDSSLLDSLCSNCLFIDPPDFRLFPGNFSEGWKQMKTERQSIEKKEQIARKEYKKIDKEYKKRRSEAAKADSKRSKKGISKKDHDAKSKKDLARMTGKDATAGKLANQLNGRLQQAKKNLDSQVLKKSYDTGIWQEGEIAKRDRLFLIDPGELALGGGRILSYPRLEMKPKDKIVLLGNNGTGKSTLIRHIEKSLTLPRDRVTYLPQEIAQIQAQDLLKEVKQLDPSQLGFVMTFVNRLGTRPPRLLESIEPSPGETRKLLLALGAAKTPQLILMDEPTNHLDLLSIQSLKEALMEFPAAMLLVSHDREFIRELTEICWQIKLKDNSENHYELVIE